MDNCLSEVTALNRWRLVLVEQKDDGPRTPSERVDIIFNVTLTNIDDLPSVDIDSVLRTINQVNFLVAGDHIVFAHSCDGLIGRLELRLEQDCDSNALTYFKHVVFANKRKDCFSLVIPS